MGGPSLFEATDGFLIKSLSSSSSSSSCMRVLRFYEAAGGLAIDGFLKAEGALALPAPKPFALSSSSESSKNAFEAPVALT